MTDITRHRGDTYADEIAVTNSSTKTAVDITGYTFIMTVDPNKYPDDATNNIMQITGNITDAANGLVEFAPTVQQADIVPGIYWYDIQMTDTLGRIRTIDYGKYKVIQDITKS